MDKKKRIVNKEDLLIAGRTFDSSDYDGTSQLEQGLAITHEQVGDDYTEGTVDQLSK
ncbi:YozQ family protein [Peribacillus asahii]|uniref:YozQ family protein n=1 Tax=Peribacillus asahii TaxID=228899 RepID=UPI00207A1F29|nr:YozQ family protein [Peribacillus asahii]USK61542.1 YozQ family protein [Peribacillus asahii]